jgi:hypothetical protein
MLTVVAVDVIELSVWRTPEPLTIDLLLRVGPCSAVGVEVVAHAPSEIAAATITRVERNRRLMLVLCQGVIR